MMAAAVVAAYPWLLPLFGAIFGAVLGSFAGCMAWRVPRGIGLRQPPSHCPSCKAILRLPDLVPVFSWLMSRGHCRHCRIPIGWQALLWDAGGALVGLVLGLVALKALP